MNYPEARACLDNLHMFRIKLGLEAMRELLAACGSPERRLACIHIAGTNGKGSTGRTLAALLTAAGFRAGFYSSPHLVSVRERFQIDGRPIGRDDFADQMTRLAGLFARAGRTPTWFECATLLAFNWFAEQAVDVAVLETGMGGRLDATNVITPLACVITDISRDHEQYLGQGIERIAAEKAGIIKPGAPVVCSGRGLAAEVVIRDFCERLGSPLYVLGLDFFAEGSSGRLDYTGIRGRRLPGLRLGLAGGHQVVNTALALAALELVDARFPVSEAVIRTTLPAVRWPGRFESFGYDWRGATRRVLLDGAHNEAGVEALTAALEALPVKRKLVLVWGNMADKDMTAARSGLFALADAVILTRAEEQRSARPEDMLAELNEQERAKCRAIEPAEAAFEAALDEAGEDALACVAGSLYLVGRARRFFCPGEAS